MSRVFIFAASKMEMVPLTRLLELSDWNSGFHAGPITAGPNQLEFFITGMGPKRARETASEVLSPHPTPSAADDRQGERPDAAIVIGLCGELTDSFPETTIVTYSSCISAANNEVACLSASKLSAQIAVFLNSQNVPHKSAIGITSPRIAITKDDKLRLAQTGAQVVDMESYEILSAAHKSGVPAAVVRVVSDSLDRKLPDFNRALNPDGSINGGKAVRVMLGSPLLTARAYASNKRAARHLANALRVVLSAEFPRLQ